MSLFEEKILSVLKYKPVEPQMQAIMETRNSVVSAGAGSGKTMVLSMRYLRLVVDNIARPDRILALTFTKKAANEMRARIYQNLIDYKEYIPKGVMETFPDSMITTLDAFSNYIARLGCQEWGIAKDFTVDNDLCADIISRVAHRFISEEDKMDEGLKILSEIYSPDELVDSVLTGIGKNSFSISDKHTAEQFEKVLLNDIPLCIEKSIKQLNAAVEDIKRVSDAYSEMLKSNAAKTASWASDYINEYSLLSQKEEIYNYFSNLSFPKVIKKGKNEANNELINPSQTVIENLKIIKLGIETLKEENCHRLHSILAFLVFFRDAVQKEQRRLGVLSFRDVSSLALEIVKTNSIIREMIKNKFDYVMIDEFQDNNISQKDLLYIICEKNNIQGVGVPEICDVNPRKLFFVGDEKQSIYKFRGADVSIFKQLSQELKKNDGIQIELTKNFRSEPYLISFFNDIFSRIMLSENPQPFEAEFRELESREKQVEKVPNIHFMYHCRNTEEADDIDGEEASGFLCEAFGIARTIASILDIDVKKRPDIMDRDYTPSDFILPGGSLPTPKDIAVLYKNSTHQSDLEKAFKYYGIPYSILDDKNMMMESIVNDIYSFLQLLIFPNDRLAYAAVLRSPICNMEDEDVIKILEDSETLCFSEKHQAEISIESDKIKYEKARQLYLEMIEMSSHSSIEKMINKIWFEYGLRLYYLANFNFQSKMGNFDFFIETAKDSDKKGESVTMYLDKIRNRIEKDQKNEVKVFTEDQNSVKLMTIHKSKGLEFPIVFICNTTSHSSNKPQPYVNYKGIPVPSWVNDDGKYVNFFDVSSKEIEKEKELAELKRVMYVAFTRAETHLVFSAYFSKNNFPATDEDSKLNTMALLFTHSAGINLCCGEDEKRHFETANKGIDISEIKIFALEQINIPVNNASHLSENVYSTVYKPVEFIKRHIGVTDFVEKIYTPDNAMQLKKFQFDDILKQAEAEDFNPYAAFGTYVHAVVENTIAGFSVPECIMENRLKKAQLEILKSDAIIMAENFVNSDFFKEVGAKGKCRTEIGMFTRKDDKVLEGFIDLLIITPDMIYVVDFKTDNILFPLQHQQQIQIYTDAVKKIYKTENVKGFLYYLRQENGIVEITK